MKWNGVMKNTWNNNEIMKYQMMKIIMKNEIMNNG